MSLEKKEYKIAITDDHALVRTAIANLINNFEGFKVVIEAATGEELLNIIHAGIIPDLVLLDLNMPGIGGKQTAQKLVADYPGIRILMLSTYTTETIMSHLGVIGVKGFLNKDSSPMEFKIALNSVLELGQYYSGIATQKLIKMMLAIQKGKEKRDNKHQKEKKKYNRRNQEKFDDSCLVITEEEIVFLQLVCTDLTYAGIAGKMKLKNERSADAMREILFEKLEVKSRSGLVMFAVRNGIVNL